LKALWVFKNVAMKGLRRFIEVGSYLSIAAGVVPVHLYQAVSNGSGNEFLKIYLKHGCNRSQFGKQASP
jgi:ABC-type lipoprotein release transport system permease subunit